MTDISAYQRPERFAIHDSFRISHPLLASTIYTSAKNGKTPTLPYAINGEYKGLETMIAGSIEPEIKTFWTSSTSIEFP